MSDPLRVLIVTPGFDLAHRGSFHQTMESFRIGLERLGVTVTVFEATALAMGHPSPPLKSFDRVVYFGPPTGQQWLRMIFLGAELLGIRCWWMLAANSPTLPPGVIGFLAAYPHLRIMTPSLWSKTAIEDAMVGNAVPGADRPVRVVPHGVEVTPFPATDPRWCHLVAGTSGRKGTEELLDALKLFPEELVIYADASAVAWVRNLAKDNPQVTVLRGYDGSAVPAWWQHARMVQPSRAEGFGLCAVEAALLGRAVVMRGDTGEPLLPTQGWIKEPHPGAWETWEGGDGGWDHASRLPPLRITPPETLALHIAGVPGRMWQPARSATHDRLVARFRHEEAVRAFVVDGM